MIQIPAGAIAADVGIMPGKRFSCIVEAATLLCASRCMGSVK